MDEKITAELQLISIEKVVLSDACIARGFIFKDTRHRWPDYTLIHTSKIIQYDHVKGILYTQNSIYKIVEGGEDHGE